MGLHVSMRAANAGRHSGFVICVDRLAKSEVCNFGVHFSIEENVARFDVAVYKCRASMAVKILQPLRHFHSAPHPGLPIQHRRIFSLQMQMLAKGSIRHDSYTKNKSSFSTQ